MPNWCSTTVALCSENKGTIEKIEKNLKEKEHSCSSNFICDILGIKEEEIVKNSRSFLVSIQDSNTFFENEKESFYYLCINLEDAWSPHSLPWQSYIKRFPDVWIEFVACEPGCELYKKSHDSILFPENYYFEVETENGDIESEELSEIGVIHMAEKFLGINFDSISEVYNFIESKMYDEDKLLSLYEYEECDFFDYI